MRQRNSRGDMEDRKTNKEELTRMATQGGQRERELRDLAVQKEPKNRE